MSQTKYRLFGGLCNEDGLMKRKLAVYWLTQMIHIVTVSVLVYA